MNLSLVNDKGEEKKIDSAEAFKSFLQVRYLESTECQDLRVQKVLEKKYQKATKHKWITQKQKWLGQYYSTELGRQGSLDLSIVFLSQEVGYGVFANQKIPVKTCIGEYAGILRKRKFFRRWENLYCFDYTIGEARSSSYVIDAKEAGNHTRFINHSFIPNLGLVSVDYQGKIRVLLYTAREILAGEQLFYDYGEEYWEKRPPPRDLIRSRT